MSMNRQPDIWHSIRVFYHDDNKDLLITRGVRPFLRLVSTDMAAAYFTVQWHQGPHIQINVRCDEQRFAERILPGAQKIIGRFLVEFPSRAALRPEEFEARHRRLAALEHRTDSLLPWAPDNTIRVAAYDGREAVLGADAASLLADFYVDTTEHAFAIAERVVKGARRTAMAFDLLVATAHALSGVGVEAGFVAFRSHAEGFLCGFREGAALRPAWEQYSRRYRRALADRLRAILDTLGGAGDGDTIVGDWVRAASPYLARGADLIRGGSTLISGTELPTDDAGVASLPEASDFHRAMLANSAWETLRSAQGFLLYRLMLNLTYLHLTRSGVTAAERFLLCHLVADAVENVFGVHASDIVSRPEQPFLMTLDGVHR